LKDAVDPSITYEMAYAEFDACIAAGLDLWAWENNVYPKEFKVMVIAWHRLNRYIRSHTEQAIADKLKKKK